MRGYVHLYGVPGIPQSTHSLTYQCTKYKRMRWHVRESCNEWLSLSIMGIPARTPINHTGMLWDVSPHNRIIRSIWKISTRYSVVTCVKWVDKILSGQNVHHQYAWIFYCYIHTTWCDYLHSTSNVYTTSIIVKSDAIDDYYVHLGRWWVVGHAVAAVNFVRTPNDNVSGGETEVPIYTRDVPISQVPIILLQQKRLMYCQGV